MLSGDRPCSAENSEHLDLAMPEAPVLTHVNQVTFVFLKLLGGGFLSLATKSLANTPGKWA